MKTNVCIAAVAAVLFFALIGVGCTKNITYNTYNEVIIKADDTANTQPLQNTTIIETDEPDQSFFNSIYDYSIHYSYRVLVTKEDFDAKTLYTNSCEQQYYNSEWHTTNCGNWYILNTRKYWGQKMINGVVYTYVSVGKSSYAMGPNAISLATGKVTDLGMVIGHFQVYPNYDWDRIPVPQPTPNIYWVQN